LSEDQALDSLGPWLRPHVVQTRTRKA
jgi:hypothetical protein